MLFVLTRIRSRSGFQPSLKFTKFQSRTQNSWPRHSATTHYVILKKFQSRAFCLSQITFRQPKISPGSSLKVAPDTAEQKSQSHYACRCSLQIPELSLQYIFQYGKLSTEISIHDIRVLCRLSHVFEKTLIDFIDIQIQDVLAISYKIS